MLLPFDRSTDTAASIADLSLADLLHFSGEQAAELFQEFYDRTSPKVHAMALAAVHDAKRADRITAQVFIDVWWRAGEFDPSAGSAEAWLSTLTRARLIDDLRHSRAERSRLSQARTQAGSPAEAWLWSIRNGGEAIVGRAQVPASAA